MPFAHVVDFVEMHAWLLSVLASGLATPELQHEKSSLALRAKNNCHVHESCALRSKWLQSWAT
jgi:hypothetical protein